MEVSTFVLVHGGGHGAWCWYKMIPLVESAGHRVLTIDLPGHGLDRTSPVGLTQHDYAKALVELLDTLDEPAILVAHSMGGMTCSLAAELRPDRVAALVFIAAVALNGGRTMMSDPALSADFVNRIAARITIDETDQTMIFPPDSQRYFFYSDCADADVALATRLVVPESLGAASTPIEVSAERFGSVRRFGIVTERDQLVLPELVREMYAEVGVEQVLTLDTGHSPFLSAPDALLEHLVDVAGLVAAGSS